MKPKNLPSFIVLMLVLFLAPTLTGCADTMTFQQAEAADPVGFWHGLWHGMIFPLAWMGSLFFDGIAVYAIYNNGGWYDFGFFLGIGGLSASVLRR